jgi:hypothetical protein
MSGGVGVLSIEVARLIPGSLAISIDHDPAACAAAATYASRAAAAHCGRARGLLGSVSVVCADMSSVKVPLRPGSVDAVGETLNVS